MHAPKVSRHDLKAKTHIIERGTLAVDRYERGDGWLYIARPLIDHPHITYMEAYLLPALGLQVNYWGHHPGSAYAWYDFYIDVMAFEVGESCWTSRDLYLDVVVLEGQAAYVADTDEYLQAVVEDLLTPAEAAFALTATHDLLNGMAEHGYSLEAYLQAKGVTLTWHKSKSMH